MRLSGLCLYCGVALFFSVRCLLHVHVGVTKLECAEWVLAFMLIDGYMLGSDSTLLWIQNSDKATITTCVYQLFLVHQKYQQSSPSCHQLRVMMIEYGAE